MASAPPRFPGFIPDSEADAFFGSQPGFVSDADFQSAQPSGLAALGHAIGGAVDENAIVRVPKEMVTGAGRQLLDWMNRASELARGGMGVPNTVEPSLTAAAAPPPDQSNSEAVGRFLTRMAPAAGVGVATGGMPVLAQAAIQGLAQGGQTAFEGGTPTETAVSGLVGGAAPIGAAGVNSVINRLPPSLKSGAAQTLAKLLRMDPGEAMTQALPLSDAPATAAAKEDFVRNAAETIGVGKGSTLVRRATTASDQAFGNLQAEKARLAGESVPTDILRQAASAAEQNIPRYDVPAPTPQMVTAGMLKGGKSAGGSGLRINDIPVPPASQNVAQLGATTDQANRLRELADYLDSASPTQLPGTLPAKDVFALRTQLGDVASPAWNRVVGEDVANKAAAAKSAYIPVTKALHEQFPSLAKVDLDAHQSKTLADLIRVAATKGMLAEAPASAVALRTGVTAPMMLAADTTSASRAFQHVLGGYGGFAVALEVLRSPLWRSMSLNGKLALADAIESGAFTAPTRALAAGVARATTEPEPQP